ncbi:hypothetical protein B0H21DRAFT_719360 [Amylocystis lapponica]|nr:hypothetical protein B0H21DRAFT_719360 [Amylocystis lapponica]
MYSCVGSFILIYRTTACSQLCGGAAVNQASADAVQILGPTSYGIAYLVMICGFEPNSMIMKTLHMIESIVYLLAVFSTVYPNS